MKVVREEIFGPVVVAAPFSDLDEIAAQANDTEYGLGAGIWTRDISKAHALAKKIRAGAVWINCYNVADAFPAGPTIWKAEARATPGGEDRSARVTYR
jgi:phenylacetaldehyde dehydrogenase